MIIVGGGDTAADCLGTANRQGALSVTVLDHNPRPARRADLVNPQLAVGAEQPRAVRRRTTRACTRRGPARSSRSSATRTGTCARCRSRRSRSSGWTAAASSGRCPTRGPSCRPTWCCWRPASSAPTCRSCSAALGADEAPGRGTVAIDDRWQTTADGVYACGDASPRGVARGVGDRRGSGVRGRGRPRADGRVRAAAAGHARTPSRCSPARSAEPRPTGVSVA